MIFNEFMLGDCLEVMPQIPDRSVDMILTDLPYGKTNRARWDVKLPLDRLWWQWKRIIKPRGAIVLTATEPFSSELVMSNQEWFRYDLIWHKNRATGHLNARKQPLRAHEQMLVFAQAGPDYYPQKTTGHVPVNQYRKKPNAGDVYGQTSWDGKVAGGQTDRYPRSVLEFKVVNNGVAERVHSNQKPVDLCQWLIKSFTLPGQTVLDCCAGSGTTLIAADLCGRQWIGIEKDPAIYAKAELRLINKRLWDKESGRRELEKAFREKQI